MSTVQSDGALPAAAFGKEAFAWRRELAVVRLQALQFASLAGWHIGAEAPQVGTASLAHSRPWRHHGAGRWSTGPVPQTQPELQFTRHEREP